MTFKNRLKDFVKPIYRFWMIQIAINLIRIGWERFVYYPITRSRYKGLRRFKDIHKGDRCFIIATGPSLTLDDLNMLKGEICFGMNSIFKFFELTDWRPNYYAIFDDTVYMRIKEDLDKVYIECPFSTNFISWDTENMNKVACLSNVCGTEEERRHYKRWSVKHMSDDISKYVHSGSSVVHFIMQICFYMGFKEIYLLGADCSNFGHHSNVASYKGEEIVSGSDDDIFWGLYTDYQEELRVSQKKGIHIYNATRGGNLEVFPRVRLEDLALKDKNA